MKRDPALEQWIEREFGGYGVAIRREEEPPITGEPFMSMEIAKELTRRAVAAFSSDTTKPPFDFNAPMTDFKSKGFT